MMECQHCNDLTGPDSMQFIPWRDLTTSAARGCSGCSIIVTGVELCRRPPTDPDTAEEKVPDFVHISGIDQVHRESIPTCEVYINWVGAFPFTPIDLFIPKGIRLVPSWPIIGSASPVPETTGSEASLQQLDVWLNRCRRQHEICRGRESYTPRRVLDLGDLDQPPSVRLHEPLPGEELEYLCLSYRWSATPGLQTLTSNVGDHKVGIPWDRLPLAFQHVCTVARRLRLRYVWIDALCIVQDDQDDKVLDIAVMDSIFEGGVLTIVSAWASGPEQGLFGHLGDFSHHAFTATTKDGVSQTVFVRRMLPHFPSPYPEHDDRRLPCLMRGWIYQELFLSPRLAFFLESEIVWQCQEHTECQCSPHRQVHSRVPFDSPRAFSTTNFGTTQSASLYWWTHVQAYSRCQLTNPSDKLPAIQGLTARMAPQLRLGRYIYGGWENSLFLDLVWSRWGRQGIRPATWRAPTWSWASIDGPVWNRGLSVGWTPLAAISWVDAPEPRCVTENSPRGRITVDCYIHVAWLRRPDRDGGESGDYLYFDELEPKVPFVADCDLGPEMDRNDEVWCAMILRRPEGLGDEEMWLVLRKVGRDCYERVGLRDNNEYMDGFKEIKGGWERREIYLV